MSKTGVRPVCFETMRGAIVCGGREYGNPQVRVDGAWVRNWLWREQKERVSRVLDRAVTVFGIEFIAQGCAPGADSTARTWAHAKGFPCADFAADWMAEGFAAGPNRNRRMLAAVNVNPEHPPIVISFPGGAGTHDMCEIARAVGLTIHEIPSLKNSGSA